MRFLLLIPFLVISCAIIPSKVTLYSQFSEYKSEVNSDNITKVFHKYFSDDLLGAESIEDPEVVDQFLFKDYMKSYFNHYEKILGSQGCLTINGFDKNNEPMAFNVEYLFYNDKWLIRNIHVLYIDDSSSFENTAKCPHEYKS